MPLATTVCVTATETDEKSQENINMKEIFWHDNHTWLVSLFAPPKFELCVL